MLFAGQAHVALTTIQVGPEGHPVADLELAVTGIGDDPAEFMSHVEIGNGLRTPTLSGFPHMDIAAAYSAGRNPDLQHAGGHFRDRYLFYLNLLRPDQHSCFHCLLAHIRVLHPV